MRKRQRMTIDADNYIDGKDDSGDESEPHPPHKPKTRRQSLSSQPRPPPPMPMPMPPSLSTRNPDTSIAASSSALQQLASLMPSEPPPSSSSSSSSSVSLLAEFAEYKAWQAQHSPAPNVNATTTTTSRLLSPSGSIHVAPPRDRSLYDLAMHFSAQNTNIMKMMILSSINPWASL